MSAWPRVNLRRIAKLGTGHTPSRQHPEYWVDCTIPWLTLADVWQLRDGTRQTIEETSEKISEIGLANSAAVLHPAGTVALSRTASVGFSCILGTDMATSQDYVTWTCGPALRPRYLLHALRGLRNEILATRMGSTHQTIYMPDIKRISVPLPPVDIQERIADYLDAETARIDALIAKKRRLRIVIDERARVKIEQLILGTKKPHSQPSPSGLYDAIPDDWHETQLRHLGCEVQTGPFGSQLHAEDYVSDGWPIVNPANIQAGKITAAKHMAVNDNTRARLSRHILKPGDIVLGRRGEMGRAGLVGNAEEGWLCGTGSIRLRLFRSSLQPAYLKLVLETTGARRYFELVSVGSTMENLNSEAILSFPCIVPPQNEQQAIVSLIEGIHGRANTIMSTIDRQISLLQEHRQALITAAVTGELDVTGKEH